jgi:ribosomal protein S18 acetylase RimI-like enzyme
VTQGGPLPTTIRRLEIRSATPADISAVLAVWEAARSAAATTPDTEAALRRLLNRDHGAVVVAEQDGRLIGTLIAAWDGWRGNMYRLAVLPEHRRRGIGKRLVEAGHARLGELGARRITALVSTDERGAAALWRAAGYEYDVKIARFVRNF